MSAAAASLGQATSGMFAGLRVIDAGTFVAAPASATILSDFGADVIKVEPPGSGDPMRDFHLTPGHQASDAAYYWTLLARNKRSVALDLKQEEDREALYRLVREADVFITNMPLKVRDRLGIAFADLEKLNPKLIYASFTGYGETGPEKDVAAFDATAWWARSGLMDQVRLGADSPPARSTAGMGDHMSSLALFGAIASALYRRERTGRGAHVGSSLIANGAWSNGVLIQAGIAGVDFVHPSARPVCPNPLGNHYLCADGRWITLALTQAQQANTWPPLARYLGLGHLIDDPRFATPEVRSENAVELIKLMDAAFATRPSPEVKAALVAAGINSSIVARAIDARDDSQMLEAGVLVPMEGAAGALTVNSPFWIEDEVKRSPQAPPKLGAHNEEVLGALRQEA